MTFKRVFVLALLSFVTNAVADDAKQTFIMNFDFDLSDVNTEDVFGSLQLQGIRLRENGPFQGKDLGEFNYFFTVTEADDGRGNLTIEFYQYETRKKKVVISEVVSEADFQFGSPSSLEVQNNDFRVDLAFSIDRR